MPVDDGAVLLIDRAGECIYASRSLTQLLQCSPQELLGHGWRVRMSPFSDNPFDPERAADLARRDVPVRLHRPDGMVEIVSRAKLITDVRDPSLITGFYVRVQVVRVHSRKIVEPSERSA